MRRRAVVTGAALITPLGVGLEESWKGLVEGRSGTAAFSGGALGGARPRAAGEIRGFDGADWLSPKALRQTGRYAQLAVAAAHMAWRDAGLGTLAEAEAQRAGCALGNAAGGLPELEALAEARVCAGGAPPRTPVLARVLANQAPGRVAAELGLRGPLVCIATACASGNNAIGAALRWIQQGDADLVVTGSTEASLSALCFGDLERMEVLAGAEGPPASACRPFDRDRTGLVPAEGAGVLVLEEERRARRRGARVYAELLGWGSSADAYHPVAPRPDGAGLRAAIERALADAGLAPDRIDYVNAHGTGTRRGDAMEALALHAALGAHARRVPVSSTKSMLGHAFGGCGGIEAVICALAIERGAIPPTLHCDAPDPACGLDCVPNAARAARVDVALSNAFGFGGTNACIALGRYGG